jgi:hypothetical protein
MKTFFFFGRALPLEPCCQPILSFIYFLIRSHFYAQAGLDCCSVYTSYIALVTGACTIDWYPTVYPGWPRIVILSVSASKYLGFQVWATAPGPDDLIFFIFSVGIFISNCCYIVTFTKVLTIYQLNSPSPSFSFMPFNRTHFSIFIHEYIIFLLHSPSYTLSLYLPPSHWYQPS